MASSLAISFFLFFPEVYIMIFMKKTQKNTKKGVKKKRSFFGILVHELFGPKKSKKTRKIAPLGPFLRFFFVDEGRVFILSFQ
jgi:hypothetical protein